MAGKIAIVALIAGVAVAIGLAVSGGGKNAAQPKTLAEVTPNMTGADPRLKRIVAQANQLLVGGEPEFQSRIDSLRGLPVVVNKWGSWCNPCRREFPAFQGAAKNMGNKVAFIGVNVNDTDADASAFLRKFPVPYPSYVDGDLKIAAKLNPASFAPVTGFYDDHGNLIQTHAGPYDTVAALERDIKRYAVQARPAPGGAAS